MPPPPKRGIRFQRSIARFCADFRPAPVLSLICCTAGPPTCFTCQSSSTNQEGGSLEASCSYKQYGTSQNKTYRVAQGRYPGSRSDDLQRQTYLLKIMYRPRGYIKQKLRQMRPPPWFGTRIYGFEDCHYTNSKTREEHFIQGNSPEYFLAPSLPSTSYEDS